jgi:hypothetical protein
LHVHLMKVICQRNGLPNQFRRHFRKLHSQTSQEK